MLYQYWFALNKNVDNLYIIAVTAVCYNGSKNKFETICSPMLLYNLFDYKVCELLKVSIIIVNSNNSNIK